MNTLDAASLILLVCFAILSLHCLLKVYFLKKYEDKKQRELVKRIGWLIFIGSSTLLIGRFLEFLLNKR